jgi:hypothetical protein
VLLPWAPADQTKNQNELTHTNVPCHEIKIVLSDLSGNKAK